jgi:hypothetical protein
MSRNAATERSQLIFDDGQVQPVSPPVLAGLGVQTVLAEGSPLLNEGLQVTVGQFAPVVTFGDVTTGIPAGAFLFAGKGSTSVQAGGRGVLRQGDESLPVAVTWANNPGNGISVRVANVSCKIQSAGQESVKAG